MPKKQTEQDPQVFKQHLDERGAVVLDRRLTPEEAAEQDERHRLEYLEQRARRWFGVDPREVYPEKYDAPESS